MAERPRKDMSKGRISIIIVGTIVAAITMILIGVWLSEELGALFRLGAGYDCAICLFACFCLVFTAYAVLNRYLTEGMFFIITALCAFICLIMKHSTDDLTSSMFYMMVAYMVCAVIFHIRGELVFEFGSILAGLSLLGISITGSGSRGFFALFSLAGLLTLLSGCFSLADIGPEWMRARNVSVHRSTSIGYAHTVTYSAGTFLSCLVFFSVASDAGSDGLLMFKILVASMTMTAGIYGACNGCHKRGIDLIILSTYSLMCAISDMYCMGVAPYINIALAVPLATSALYEYREGSTVSTVCSLLFAAVMVCDAFLASTEFFHALVTITKVIVLYDSVSTWFIFETGWAPRYLRYNKRGTRFDER